MPAAVQTFDEAKNAVHNLFEILRARLPAEIQNSLIEESDTIFGEGYFIELQDPRNRMHLVSVEVWLEPVGDVWSINLPDWLACKVELPVPDSSIKKYERSWNVGVDALSLEELATLFIKIATEFAA